MSLIGILCILLLVLVLVIVILGLFIRGMGKEISKLEDKNRALTSEIMYQEQRDAIRNEVFGSAHKDKEKLKQGTNQQRFDAAISLMHNGGTSNSSQDSKG